jgi:hypothetical protein
VIANAPLRSFKLRLQKKTLQQQTKKQGVKTQHLILLTNLSNSSLVKNETRRRQNPANFADQVVLQQYRAQVPDSIAVDHCFDNGFRTT